MYLLFEEVCHSFTLGTVLFYDQTQMLVTLFVSSYNEYYVKIFFYPKHNTRTEFIKMVEAMSCIERKKKHTDCIQK